MTLSLELVATWVVMPALGVAILVALFALLRGPQLADRVVALDLLATNAVAVAAVLALSSRQAALLDVAIVVALLAFLSTVGFTHYMERHR